MRKIARAPIEVFSLSFLDIISCAFGAIVMLVLLSKNANEEIPAADQASSIGALIQQLTSAKSLVEALQNRLSSKQTSLADAQSQSSAERTELDRLQQAIPRATESLKKLEDKAQTIRQDIVQANALLNTPASTDEPDIDVGGVPTDADYVVFIIDNSGSMKQIGWNKIINVVSDVIENHPKLKGFNVMAADGRFLPVKKGGWIEDTRLNRKNVLNKLKRFQGGGSNPEVGILKAIDRYKNQQGKVSLYVFGDEYQLNIRSRVEQITLANLDPATQKPRFRIHGIGFFWRGGGGNTRQGFASFMKAVAYNNRGAFIAVDTK